MAHPAYEKLKRCDALPSPAGVVMEILRLASDEKTTINAISAVVETDPALGGQMLRLVNSPFSGLPRKIASVTAAVRLLGIRTVKNLALSLSLVSNYRNGRCTAFDYEAFWSKSLLRAVAARGLANKLEEYSSEEAFTIGLLSKVGQLAFATVFPKEYACELSRQTASETIGLLDAERSAFSIDHDELSAEMIADWYLPAMFCQAVRGQDRVDPACPAPDLRTERFTRVLRLAGRITSLLTQPQAGSDSFAAMLSEAEQLGIGEQILRPLLDVITSEWREAGAVFSVAVPDVPGSADPGGSEPAADAQSQSLQSSTSAAADVRPAADPLRILIVDDDSAVVHLLEKYLTGAGYRVMTADSSSRALEIDRIEAPQMVITDLMMPQMDGLELCRRLRPQEGAGFLYIIVLTARLEKSTMVEAIDAGADDFLTKPFGREELLAHVRAGERIVRLEAKLAERSREVSRFNARLAAANDKLRALATIDELTGLPNRREAMARLAEHWALATRNGVPLSCIIGDVDHFKTFNDTHGHAVGDVVLKATSAALRRASRASDIVCRLGGEEFLVICPSMTAVSAEAAAERLRQAIEEGPVRCGTTELSVTLSFGVAEHLAHMRSPDDLLKSADDALYIAKRSGRNRVCVSGQIPAAPPADSKLADAEPVAGLKAGSHPIGSLPLRVLLVGDDTRGPAAIRKVLEQSSCSLSGSATVSETMDRILACSPEVIVLDAQAPHLDAKTCVRHLRGTPEARDIPIIMVTAGGEAEKLKNGLEGLVDDLITKPILPTDFVRRVQTMGRLYRSKAELMRSNQVRWEQGRAMQLLLELARSLAGAANMDEILEGIIKATAELTWARRISIMLPNRDGTSLAIAKAIGIEDDTIKAVRIVPGQGIAGRVFLSGQPVMINSPEAIDVLETQYDSQFFVSTPLMSRALRTSERMVGVLNITDRFGQRPFEPQVLESIEMVCGIGAAAISHFLARETRDQARDALVVALATLTEHRDLDTARHLERVTKYAMLLAAELRKQKPFQGQIDDAFLQDLQRAVPLHDIGKVGVPDHILLKPGKLTETEFATMKRHTHLGAATIQSIINRAPGARFLKMAEEVTHGHHEWYDGTGYPRGLQGDAIPLAARIAALADVYDALTSRRPYKAPIPPKRAGEIICHASGTQFDPAIVDAFVRCEARFVEVAARLADDPEGAGGSELAPVEAGCTAPGL